MKKEMLQNLLYEAVELTSLDGEKHIGWFVPYVYYKQTKYAILPLNDFYNIYTFSASNVKQIMFLKNGFILK